MADKDTILRRVQGLLNKAASTDYSAERDALIAKADELMAVYAIEAFELDAMKPKDQRQKPVTRRFTVASHEHPFATTLVDIAFEIAKHCRCRAIVHNLNNARYSQLIDLTVVGFPADTEWAELLFTSVNLQLSAELEPKPSPDLSFEENLAVLKESGLKWIRIHEIMKAHGLMPDEPWERRIGVRFTGIYTKFCKETNRDRQYTAPETYRRNFVAGFYSRLTTRLHEMREMQKEHTTGKELVLYDAQAAVNEAFKEAFPITTKEVMKRKSGKEDLSALRNGARAAERADLSVGQGKMSNSPRALPR